MRLITDWAFDWWDGPFLALVHRENAEREPLLLSAIAYRPGENVRAVVLLPLSEEHYSSLNAIKEEEIAALKGNSQRGEAALVGGQNTEKEDARLEALQVKFDEIIAVAREVAKRAEGNVLLAELSRDERLVSERMVPIESVRHLIPSDVDEASSESRMDWFSSERP